MEFPALVSCPGLLALGFLLGFLALRFLPRVSGLGNCLVIRSSIEMFCEQTN
jgi:hypothetical protein